MKRKLTLIINGMFYGDAYTKRCLWSVFLLCVLGIGCLLVGAALLIPWLFVAAAVLFVVDVILFRSLDLSVGAIEVPEEGADDTSAGKPKQQKEKNPKKRDTKQSKADREKDLAKKQIHKNSPNRDERQDKQAGSHLDYSEKELKKLFRTYKVKKNHRPVMIDYCAKYRITQTPAYAWVFRGQFYLLVLEEKPRKIMLPESQVKTMHYEKGVKANQKKEYPNLVGRNLMNVVFNEYKPTYYTIIRKNVQEEVKNLYVIGPNIKFTNTSAKELLHLLNPEFVVEDEVTKSDDYNQYFKMVYSQRILLNDGVLNIKEYQDKIRTILRRLAEASMPSAAIRMSLAEMAQQQLISTEYMNYYIQYNRQYRERNKTKNHHPNR